jgi:branched-chain amino acid transport system ATP-binding protein
MVAIARALMTTPRLIPLDEPSLGLSPKFVTLIFEKLVEMKDAGYTLMLVPQNAVRALAVADRGYVLELGAIGRKDGPVAPRRSGRQATLPGRVRRVSVVM